jgi:hypothetical protein
MSTIDLTFVTAIIGAVTGLVGTILGIIAVWDQLSKNRVRLRVVPRLSWPIDAQHRITFHRAPTSRERERLNGRPPDQVCIEVVNLSTFAVTISEITIGRNGQARAAIVGLQLSRGKTMPVRLESREAVEAYVNISAVEHHDALNAGFVCVKTDCGTVVHGTSPLFRQFARSHSDKVITATHE